MFVRFKIEVKMVIFPKICVFKKFTLNVSKQILGNKIFIKNKNNYFNNIVEKKTHGDLETNYYIKCFLIWNADFNPL